MTSVRVSLIDVYILRGAGPALQLLILRRAPGGRCPGSWESVHGHIEAGEEPAAAAARELEEETGLISQRLYNLSRVETFYQHRTDEVALIPVFAAFVAPDATVHMSREHDAFEWLSPTEAGPRLAWPRERRALEDIVALLHGGDAGAVDDVLRIC
jgi:8-oxo-dGTP pyrophosphatase MutT (NUDIX family)